MMVISTSSNATHAVRFCKCFFALISSYFFALNLDLSFVYDILPFYTSSIRLNLGERFMGADATPSIRILALGRPH